MQRVLCVIPARGGSKGVPGKNIRPLAGRPLLEWTVERALNSGVPMRVVVSTDSVDIADVARRAGAEVPFLRPSAISHDTSATEEAVVHALDMLRNEGFDAELVLLLQVTSPIRREDTIRRAFELREREDADTVVGVVRQPIFMWRRSKEGGVPLYDVEHRPMRQDTPEDARQYYENGSLYLTRTAIYRRFANRIGGRVALLELSSPEAIDIDDERDFIRAEQAMEEMLEK